MIGRKTNEEWCLSFNEIGAYFGMKGSAISQLSRRFRETIKGDKELGRILVTPDPSVFSWGC